MVNSPELTGNTFLDSLSAETRSRLVPLLRRSSLKRGQLIGEPGVQIEEVCFPIRSVISTLTRMHDGGAVEVGLTGHEGMSGLAIIFGSRTSTHTSIVQLADSAYCLGADVIVKQLENDASFMQRALAYAGYSFVAATQFAACNRLHPIEERYARWLLMAEDRVGANEFVLTQEFSAQMLGVRRAGVTVVAGTMSAAGLISYRRGNVSILDRQGLEHVACECYDVVNKELRRSMGYGARQMTPASVVEAADALP